MRSIRELYIIGHGPSSSHTMGVAFACEYVKEKYLDIKEVNHFLSSFGIERVTQCNYKDNNYVYTQ